MAAHRYTQRYAGWLAVSLVGLGFVAAAGAEATDTSLSQEDRIAELERTVAILADELERSRRDAAVPEDLELTPRHGSAPGASKVYDLSKGLSMGGYGEAFYRKLLDDDGPAKDRTDALRMVLYAGYKFTENIIFNAEFEFEHATTGGTATSPGGSVSVEFAHLDFLWKEWMNFRVGLLLVPMGFINEIHEPPFFYGVNRPEVERQIIPSTWRENGVGVMGSWGEEIEYEAYVINGLNAEGFDTSGVRGGRQKGNRALAEHLAVVGKVSWTPIPELLIGGSIYHGKSGQNQQDIPETATTIWETHAQYTSHGWHLRSLFTMAHLGDVGDLTRALGPAGLAELDAGDAIGGEMLGVYGEVAYDVLPLLFPDTAKSLEPFFRFEYYNTQRDVPSGFSRDRTKEIQSYTVGVSYKPIPNVVIKADYRNRVSEAGGLPDELNMGIGFVF